MSRNDFENQLRKLRRGPIITIDIEAWTDSCNQQVIGILVRFRESSYYTGIAHMIEY